MRYLCLFALAAITASLPAQTTTATSTVSSGSTMTQAQAEQIVQGNVTAELTKKIDSKKSKVGDPVTARMLSAATLPNGTELPKGTRLAGKITEVQPGPGGYVTFAFDQAVLHNGQTVAVRAMVTGAAVPALNPPLAGAAGGSAASPPGTEGDAAPASSPAGGRAIPNNNATADIAAAQNEVSAAPSGEPASSAGAGTITVESNGVIQIRNVPVTNLRGVLLSSTNSGDAATTVRGPGKSVSLDSGTQLRLEVIPAQ
jgi:hypothetical protein